MTGPRINHVEARASRTPVRQNVSDSHDHRPNAGEFIDTAIQSALRTIADRDAALLESIAEDISRNGSRWAANEIFRLRQDLARCRRELRDCDRWGAQ